MTVSITWASTPAGGAITPPNDLGDIGNGKNATDDIYIRHNGANKITACGFFIQAYSGSYTGGATAAADYSELLEWGGRAGPTPPVGGFYIAQDSPTWTYAVHKTGQGTVTVPIALSCGSVAAEIQNTEEVHIKIKVAVPSDEDTAGTRQFDQVLKFTYTS